MKSIGLGYAKMRRMTAEEKAQVWEIRKAFFGLLMGTQSDYSPELNLMRTILCRQPICKYDIRRFEKIVADHYTTASYDAHASVGLLHNRPVINLKK